MDPVSPKRAAIAAGALAAVYVVALFAVRPVPDRVAGWLGAPGDPLDRTGGLRVTYRPPAGADRAELERSLADRSRVRRAGDRLVLDYPGVTREGVPALREVLTAGGLQLRESLELPFAVAAAAHAPSGVELDVDVWREAERGDRQHEVAYLRAGSRAALESAVAAAAAAGVAPPDGARIGYELAESHRAGSADEAAYWRTHVLAGELVLDGTMIESALVSYDPNSYQPIVLLDLTADATGRFCEMTRRMVGRKLAHILAGRVHSAPVIDGPICGGQASIRMGQGTAEAQEAEAAALAALLAQGGIPAGGVIEREDWRPAADFTVVDWLARLVLGVAAGALFGALALAVLRVARPVRRAVPPRPAGRFPWRRLAVTLIGPIAVLAGDQLMIPGVNGVQLGHVLGGGSDSSFTVIAFGVMPVLTAFVLVELVALAVPGLRWRRHDPLGRVRLGQAVAVVAVAIALIQAWFATGYIERLAGPFGGILVPDLWYRPVAIVSLAGGTLALAAIAGVIREHGLGNGYAVLLVSAFAIWLDPIGALAAIDRERLLGAAAALVVAAGTVALLRWRITGAAREPALRVPSCGLAPLSEGGGAVAVIGLLVALGLGTAWGEPPLLLAELRASTWRLVALVAVLVPLASWLFARPGLIARIAVRAGLAGPSGSTWLRATLLSGLLLVTAALVALVTRAAAPASSLADAGTVMLASALALDLIDDARAHRVALVPAAVLHQIQRAGPIEHALAGAGIPYHIHASNLRTLLAFFGPWAPAIVLVPVPHAVEARLLIEDLTRPQ